MEPANKKYIIFSIVIIYVLIFLGGSYSQYGLQSTLFRQLFFMVLILMLYVSKDKVFWLATFFIIICHPFSLFKSGTATWLYNITSTVGLPFTFIFPIILYFKYAKEIKQSPIRNYFHKYYFMFINYFLILIIIGYFYGHNISSLYSLGLSIPILLLFIIIPRYFTTIDELLKFDKIIFAFSLTHSIISFVDVISSGSISSFLTFNHGFSTGSYFTENLTRLTGNITIALYAIIKTSYYLLNRNLRFNQNYLWLTLIISSIYITNSATRGWMIATFIYLVVFLWICTKSLRLKPSMLFIGIMLFSLIIFILPNLESNLNASFERLSTLELLMKGDETAGGTLSRISERGPKVLSQFSESPIFGFGFSSITQLYYDGHVGNHSLLLQSGIIGFLIVWVTIILLIKDLLRFGKKFSNKGYTIFAIAIITIMIIHSSSRIMIGFNFPIDTAILFCLLFSQVNLHSINNDYHAK